MVSNEVSRNRFLKFDRLTQMLIEGTEVEQQFAARKLDEWFIADQQKWILNDGYPDGSRDDFLADGAAMDRPAQAARKDGGFRI